MPSTMQYHSDWDLNRYDYAACYCEENVFQLLRGQPAEVQQHALAIFISNPRKKERYNLSYLVQLNL